VAGVAHPPKHPCRRFGCAIGLWVRARAAGHLHKQEILTVTGPYAFTRNPLYLGSFILMIGAAIAAIPGGPR